MTRSISAKFATAFVAVTLLVGSALGQATRSEAAGITTHGWMAVEAIDHVSNPGLRTLLEAHRDQVRAGASFPDVGYVLDNTYGEEAHWQRFVDAYLDLIAAQPGCGDLSNPTGPCAGLIAHAFGIAAHGMGDEVWDWLFEPNGPDLDEYFVHPDIFMSNEDGAEVQMDIVAIGQYGIPRPETPLIPDVPLVLQAFEKSGFTGVTADQFALVELLPVLWDAEKIWSDAHLTEVQAAMPWMSDNLVTAPGGVDFAATAIAGYWSTMWGRLDGSQPRTSVSITYPASNQTDIPATGWDRASFDPGSSRGRGGARNRITAVLTSARPYVPATGGPSVPRELPAATMTITEVDGNVPVALKTNYPRSVPYGGSAGQHLVDVQPAENLAECTWYRVDVGVHADLVDARDLAITPYSWSFRTECAEEPPATTVPSTAVTTTTSLPANASIPTTTTLSVAPATAPRTTAPVLVAVRPTRAAIPVSAQPSYTG